MFDFVRKHTKIMMFLMFLLIIPAFVLVGINGFRSVNGGGETVAKVAGTSIKKEEWDAAHKYEVDNLRNTRPNMDPKLLDSPEARYALLERLVRDRVLADAVSDQHLTTTDAALARELQRDPEIAALRRADGRLDIDRYRQLAAAQGLTTEGFEAQVRRNLTLRQVEGGVGASSFSPVGQAAVALNAFFERRELQVANFSPADFRAQVHPADAEIEAYYQANQNQFQAAESANVEYLILDMDSVKKSIAVNDADLRSYYEQNVARLSGKEERRASHILLTASKTMAAGERQKVREKAQALLEQARKAPDSFAEMAKKNSQDPGSAAKGGDLDFFARGAMVKPFEDAVFSMKKGEISDIVESDFGFHIIKLLDVKAPKQKTFDELKSALEAELRNQQAQRKYAEVSEIFANGVYEQADSLQPVAEKLKLEVHKASNVQRKPLPGVAPILANPKLLAALFSPDSIEKKRNTEAVETAPSQMVSARIVEYTPARVLPLAEVRASVVEKLVQQQANALAKKDGAAKLDAWKAQPDSAKLGGVQVVSRQATQAQVLAPALLNAALRADTSKLPAWVGVDLGAQGYAVVRVNKVLERSAPTEDVALQERNQYAKWMASAENAAYLEMLKARFKAQIKVAKPSPNSNSLASLQE